MMSGYCVWRVVVLSPSSRVPGNICACGARPVGEFPRASGYDNTLETMDVSSFQAHATVLRHLLQLGGQSAQGVSSTSFAFNKGITVQ